MNKPTKWEPSPNNLEPFWMGFTPNRAFKQNPRMIARAKDMHYFDLQGRPMSRRLRWSLVLQCWPLP